MAVAIAREVVKDVLCSFRPETKRVLKRYELVEWWLDNPLSYWLNGFFLFLNSLFLLHALHCDGHSWHRAVCLILHRHVHDRNRTDCFLIRNAFLKFLVIKVSQRVSQPLWRIIHIETGKLHRLLHPPRLATFFHHVTIISVRIIVSCHTSRNYFFVWFAFEDSSNSWSDTTQKPSLFLLRLLHRHWTIIIC